MLLAAMVSKSRFDDLLKDLGFDEIKSLTMVETLDADAEIPLVTAQITPDRWHDLAEHLQATPVLDNYISNNWDRLDVIACSEAGWTQSDNNIGVLSLWVHNRRQRV